jgi:hypothetical protein
VLEDKEDHGRDINEYIENRLRGPTSETAVQELTKMIRSKAAGVFMWVVLVVDILNRELEHGGTITGAKRRLEKLPSKLCDLFKDILLRDGTDKDGLLLCLGWILYAHYPLASAKLYYALQVGLNPEDEETLAERDQKITTDEPIQLFILHKSKGLAEITASDAVQFIHESVGEFVINDTGIQYLWHAGEEDFYFSRHDRLKDGCLFYLKVCKPLLGLVQKVQKVNITYPLREDSILRNWHVNTDGATCALILPVSLLCSNGSLLPCQYCGAHEVPG